MPTRQVRGRTAQFVEDRGLQMHGSGPKPPLGWGLSPGRLVRLVSMDSVLRSTGNVHLGAVWVQSFEGSGENVEYAY
jgi:hypothetical protein